MDSGGKMEAGQVKSGGMNQHKLMAGAGRTDNFGVSKFPARDVPHPDVGMKHEAMPDESRGAKPPIKGNGMLMQAAPDHGGMGPDHFQRGGKV